MHALSQLVPVAPQVLPFPHALSIFEGISICFLAHDGALRNNLIRQMRVPILADAIVESILQTLNF